MVCLAVAQVLLGFNSERRWIRYLRTDPVLRAMFPYVPRQSGYHKRLKAALPLLCTAIQLIAERCCSTTCGSPTQPRCRARPVGLKNLGPAYLLGST